MVRKRKERKRSLMVQLIVIPMAILWIILIGLIFYGLRVAEIMNANAREIRTATLKEIASGLQTDLNQYKLFVANHLPALSTRDALKGENQLAAYQAKQSLEEDWRGTFQLYPQMTGLFLWMDEGFWCMVNPTDEYISQSYASPVLKEWAGHLGDTDPYPQSWTLLGGEERERILVCAIRESGMLFGVWLDVESIHRRVSQYYGNENDYRFTEMSDSEARKVGDRRNITVYAALEEGRFAILEEVGRQELLQELYRLNYLLEALILVTILMFTWYMYLNYHRIAQSIQRLIGVMRQTMQTGQIIQAEDDASFREFHELVDIYNSFLARNDSLEDHIAKEKLRYQEVRRQYLELQIRPHFYVNIISGVLGYIGSRNMDQARQLLQCMAAHLSYILYNKEGRARLGDELRFAQNYIEIQKLRFGGRFSFTADVDAEYMDIMVPVLSVQTFIENTSKYVERKDGICVWLSAGLIERDDAEYLQVTIEDNGSGYPQEILEAFKRHEEIYYNGKKHVGIRNLYERMHQLYGDESSLVLQNGEGSGALACWIVPIL